MENEDPMKNSEEINQKRKRNRTRLQELDEDDNENLNLALALALCHSPRRRRLSPIQQSPSPPQLPPRPQRRLSPIQPLPPPLPAPQPPQQQPMSMQEILQLSQSHPLYNNIPHFPPLHTSASNPNIIRNHEPATGTANRYLRPPSRTRRNPTQVPREGKSDTVPVPYPWATNRRAMVHTLNYLVSKQIFTITGEVQCKRCERQFEMEYDLRDKFLEIGSFIAENKNTFHDRAPSMWMNPNLPPCKFCDQESCARPVFPEKKKAVNWLFLLLGQMLGCCTLEQLKYFCKHTKNHRTGAKDRVLYLTYLGLCKQLDPNGPFDR